MKYTLTVVISSIRGIERINRTIASEAENVYNLEPAVCIPDDSIVLGVSGDNVDI